MALCGTNFSTAACPQQCLRPETAFQPQNVFACLDEAGAGWINLRLNVTPWNPVVEILDNCMSQYCSYTDQSVGGCPYLGVDRPGRGSLTSEVYGNTDHWLCKNVNGQVNPDLGGIGVIVSFLMQAGLSLVLQFSLRFIEFLRYWPWMSSQMTPSVKSKLEEQEAVLKSIAVEFQEAQCFFMLAYQSAILAIIKSLSKDPQFLGTQTLRAVKYNLAMSRLVCLGGVLPVTFVLYIIYTIGMSSIFICALSGCTIFLAVCSFFAVPTNFSSASLSPLPYQSKLDKCGQNPPPVVFCQGLPVSQPELMTGVIVLCILAYILILSCTVRSYVERRHILSGSMRRNNVVSRFMKFCGPIEGNVPRLIRTVFGDILFLFLNIGYFLLFRPFWSDGVIDSYSWSFGQVVAVTIWLPVIIKYLYWTKFGMDGHSNIHIAAPYEITRTKSDYQKAKQALGDDEALPLTSSSTGRPAPLHHQSEDEPEDEPITISQKASVSSILHARTY